MEYRTIINGKSFTVKKTGNRYFRFSPASGRYFPIAASEVIEVAEQKDDSDYNNTSSPLHY